MAALVGKLQDFVVGSAHPKSGLFAEKRFKTINTEHNNYDHGKLVKTRKQPQINADDTDQNPQIILRKPRFSISSDPCHPR